MLRSVVVTSLAAGLVGSFQQAPPRPRITGINHVAFRVSDPAAAREFYADMLGLNERRAHAGRIEYGIGPNQAVVLEPGLRSGEDERLSHIAVATPDIAALTAYLTSRNITILQSPQRCEESAIRVTDPDGHTIEFVQVKWPPDAGAVPHMRSLSDRLLHAGAIVRDEERAQTFYRDVLGFIEIWRGGRADGVTRWINMRVPDGTDYLEYMLASSSPDRRERGVLHHLCLRVPDMQVAWEEVARRSVRLQRPMPSPPQIGINGRYQLNLYDSDGTRVELMEPFTVR